MKYFSLLLFLIPFCLAAQSLQNIESVEYDPTQNRFLVSNSSNIIARNSDGSLDYFGTGAASYGMEVLGNTIFVIQGTSVQGYDLTTETQVMTISIPGATFLNGMTNDGDQNLYVTDFSARKIHKINVSDFANPTTEVIVNNTVTTPNGIVYDGDNNRLIFVNWGNNAKIKAVDLSDNSVTDLTTTPYGNIDGIDEDNEGNYYISYWSSGTRISKYDANFASAPETVTITGISSPADICYAKAIDTLAIPHSGNQLSFIGFEPPVGVQEEILDEVLQLSVTPNPVQENTSINFELPSISEVSLNIYDTQGKLLHTLLNGKQVNGAHRVVLQGIQLPTGISFAQLRINGITRVIKLVNTNL